MDTCPRCGYRAPKELPQVRRCKYVDCGERLPRWGEHHGEYCGPVCRKAAARERQAIKKEAGETKKPGRRGRPRLPRAVKAVESKPVRYESMRAACEGCVYFRENPETWSGVECAGGLVLKCEPLKKDGRVLWRSSNDDMG